jgi:hypothetical protein
MVLLSACGTFTETTFLNAPPRPLPPRPAESVQVFSAGPPSIPHVDVALIEARQTRSLNEQGTDLMIQRLREQAGAIGCDAIVLGGLADHQGSRDSWVDPGATIRQATCIVYADEPEPVATGVGRR